MAGQHAFEHLAEHRLIAAAPDSARPNRTRQKPVNSVLGQYESLGHHFGLGVEIVETVGVGQRLVSTGDALAAHHHAVGRGVDEPFHPGGLRGAHQVLGSLDVDGETALPVLLGDRRATHQLDERRGVKDGVDPGDGARDDLRVADVALQHFQARLGGQWGGCPVEGSHLVTLIEQGGYQVGADEAGAAGDEHSAQRGGRRSSRNLNHAAENN